ncbi:hypothetical protein [Crocinitomix catalasitica]|uniref:hypothetical protein n=1 Tax=Crocinitomix catalasitica TaxID=184607 RepID=UPI000907D860|nr:hypothetical protein [Crocinitomix catalasitica]
MTNKVDLKSQKLKDLVAQLNAETNKEIVDAIKALKIHGDESIIEPLLLTLKNNDDGEVQGQIIDLLNTVKSTKVPAQIAKFLLDKRFVEQRLIMLSSIWNSGLDYTTYLKEIVQVGIEGDLMEAVECITIIENIEQTLFEENLFEPLLVLSEYFHSHIADPNPKDDILREITDHLKNLNNLL